MEAAGQIHRSRHRSRQRTPLDACRDAWPDAVAALACAIAWAQPDALGFDLLATAGLLYFIELPLATIAAVAIVRRIRHPDWTRRDKLGHVLIPTLLLAWIGGMLFGLAGLLAILWLGARSMMELLRDAPDAHDATPAMWLRAERIGNGVNLTLVAQPSRTPSSGTLLIPAGHEHIMAFATAMLWFVILVLMMFLPALGSGGATADYAASVGWHDTVIGHLVPAHIALAAGLLLFGTRTLLHFEGTGNKNTPAPLRIEDDEALREVIAKVEGRRPGRGRGNSQSH